MGDVAVLERLATGGMGILERGVQAGLEREVALKRLRDPNDPVARERLSREAVLTARLEHPSVVPIHDLYPETPVGPVVVLKRLRGRPWSDVLNEAPSDPDVGWLRKQLGVVRQLCGALAYAHSQRVVHLDLKSENIMVDEHGDVRLFDWGIAHDLENDPPRTAILGTPAFLAPEMIAAGPKQLDERTDVYLLGGCLYELIYGRGPHEAESFVLSIASVLEGASFPPCRMPDELVDLARCALAPDPRDRFANMRAFGDALDALDRHLDSIALTHRALELLEQPGLTVRERERIGYRLTSALTLWPDNPRATEALRALRLTLVEHHIQVSDLGAARRVAELAGELPPALEDRLDALSASLHAIQTAEGELDEQRQHDRDAYYALSQVLLFLWALSLAGTAIHAASTPDALGDASIFVGVAALLGVAAVALRITRERWSASIATRTSAMVMIAVLVSASANHLASVFDARTLSQLYATDTLLVGVSVLAGSSLERRAIPLGVGALALGCMATAQPELAPIVTFVTSNAMVVGTLQLWRHRMQG